MSLPYWVEYLLTVPSPDSKRIGNLVSQIGSEYYAPIVPPATEFYFRHNPLAVGAYAHIYYKATFGYMVPGAFRLNIVSRGVSNFNGVLQGRHLDDGLDYFFSLSSPDEVTSYITNISPMNQMFHMISQYLRIQREEDYREVFRLLDLMRTRGIAAPSV